VWGKDKPFYVNKLKKTNKRKAFHLTFRSRCDLVAEWKNINEKQKDPGFASPASAKQNKKFNLTGR
jgi:hypothetical protein